MRRPMESDRVVQFFRDDFPIGTNQADAMTALKVAGNSTMICRCPKLVGWDPNQVAMNTLSRFQAEFIALKTAL